MPSTIIEPHDPGYYISPCCKAEVHLDLYIGRICKKCFLPLGDTWKGKFVRWRENKRRHGKTERPKIMKTVLFIFFTAGMLFAALLFNLALGELRWAIIQGILFLVNLFLGIVIYNLRENQIN